MHSSAEESESKSRRKNEDKVRKKQTQLGVVLDAAVPTTLAPPREDAIVHALAIASLRATAVVGHGIEPEEAHEGIELSDAIL